MDDHIFCFYDGFKGWCGDVVGSLIQLPFTSSELVVSKHGLNFDNSSYFSMSQKKLKFIAVMEKIRETVSLLGQNW